MGLNWLGQRANPGDQSPFKIYLGITIVFGVWTHLFMKLLKQRCFDPSTLLPSRFIDLSTGLPVEGSLYWVIKWVNRVDIVVGVFLSDSYPFQDPSARPRAQQNPRDQLPRVRTAAAPHFAIAVRLRR